jgi:hypothetical protein
LSKNTGGCKIIKFVFLTISSVLISDLIIFWQNFATWQLKKGLATSTKAFWPFVATLSGHIF